jgi:hypothetical protein
MSECEALSGKAGHRQAVVALPMEGAPGARLRASQ